MKFRHSEDKKDLMKKVKKMRREIEDVEGILENCIEEEEEYDEEDYREDDEMDDRDMRREMRRTRMRSSGGRYRRM